MATMKFISSKTISSYADEYHANQMRLAELRAEQKELESTQEKLARHLLKQSVAGNFRFNSADGYIKQLKRTHVEKFVIDNEKVRQMLKKKTPYKELAYDILRIDWMYE
jgi:predicted metal-dependent phosphoesterase TrpH